MGDDRPYGDDGFADPRRRGWVATIATAVWRGVVGTLAGSDGRVWPRQAPLDPPDRKRDHRP